MRTKRWLVASAALAAGLAATGGSGAFAAGYALKEQSPTAQGSAFAGATAEAADVSYMFYNPASMSYQSGSQAIAGLNYIAPQSEANNVGARTAAGAPITGGDGGSDAGENAVIPVFYGMTSVSERLKVGMGVNVPFGLETSYNDGWAGRYHALDSELATINFNPAVSYEPVDGVALGAGLQAQYVTAELSNAVDFGSIGAANPNIPFGQPTQNDGRAEVEGDDWGFGFNVGVIVEPLDGTRLGAAYRSEIEHTLSGDADFSGGGQVRGALAQGNAFTDTGVSADLTTPDLVSFGLYQELTSDLAIMGEFQYTFWSDFQELRVEFDNNTPDSVTEQDWRDSFFVSAGAKYDVSDALSLRTGVAFDESPIPDETRTPRVPANDRAWISIGANYNPYTWFTVNASYTHLFVEPGDIDLDANDPGNQTRGDLRANVENTVDVATISATLHF